MQINRLTLLFLVAGLGIVLLTLNQRFWPDAVHPVVPDVELARATELVALEQIALNGGEFNVTLTAIEVAESTVQANINAAIATRYAVYKPLTQVAQFATNTQISRNIQEAEQLANIASVPAVKSGDTLLQDRFEFSRDDSWQVLSGAPSVSNGMLADPNSEPFTIQLPKIPFEMAAFQFDLSNTALPEACNGTVKIHIAEQLAYTLQVQPVIQSELWVTWAVRVESDIQEFRLRSTACPNIEVRQVFERVEVLIGDRLVHRQQIKNSNVFGQTDIRVTVEGAIGLTQLRIRELERVN